MAADSVHTCKQRGVDFRLRSSQGEATKPKVGTDAQLMEEAGLATEERPMSAGTPFANSLIIGRKES